MQLSINNVKVSEWTYDWISWWLEKYSAVVVCNLSLKYMINQENGKKLVNLLQYKTQIKLWSFQKD